MESSLRQKSNEHASTTSHKELLVFNDLSDDFILEFHDKKPVQNRYCLIMRDYDGKGIFILRFRHQPNVIGLFEIVHFLKPRHLLHPLTVRDVISTYVADISIFEYSMDEMNLVTERGVRVRMKDPLVKVFGGGRYLTEILYLQNKRYLSGKKLGKGDILEESDFSRSDIIGISIAVLLAIVIICILCFVQLY